MVTLNHMLNLNSKIRIPDGIYESTSPLLPSPHPLLLCLSILYPPARSCLPSAVSPVCAFICFIKSPLLGPLNSECLYLLYPSKYLCFSGSMILNTKQTKQRKQKINRILSQVERDHERKERVIFSCLQWHFFFAAFWVFIGSCKFRSLPCVEARQSGRGGSCEIMIKRGVRSGLRRRCLGLRWKQYRFISDRDIYISKYIYLYIHIYMCIHIGKLYLQDFLAPSLPFIWQFM